MRHLEIAKLFHEITDLLEIKDENVFKIRAYRRAAMNLESLTEEIEAVAARGGLAEIAGIGKDLAAKIQQAIETGHMEYLEELRAEIPRGVVDLMAIPGVGPKTAKLLFQQLQVDSVERLETLALQGKLLGLPGIKQKTVENILKGIQVVKAGRERMPLGRALPLAHELVQILEKLPDVKQISLAGSLRRMRETVKDVDLLVTSTKPAKVMAVFAAAKQYGKALEINAQPSRLDLNDHHARRAKELGVRLAISTDTHSLDQLDNMSLGVATARRAWIEKSDVINAWPLNRLLAWTHKDLAQAPLQCHPATHGPIGPPV
jgi:DNA polymerase/3'-5' exonuclease PolX